MHNLVKIHLVVLNISNGNEILTSVKGHNYVTNFRKQTCNNPILHIPSINAYAKLGKFHQFVLKILSGNQVLKSIKGHNSVINSRKLTRNNPNLDLVHINAYAKFGQISSILS